MDCDLLCFLCHGILQRTVSHVTCNAKFCEKCIDTLLETSLSEVLFCPVCQNPFTTGSLLNCIELDYLIENSTYSCRCGDLVRVREHFLHSCAASSGQIAIQNQAASTYKCPHCFASSLSREAFLDHYSQKHREQPGVCPICSSMPWGDSSYVCRNLFAHLKTRHQYEVHLYTDTQIDDETAFKEALETSKLSY